MHREDTGTPGIEFEEPGEELDRLATGIIEAAIEVHRHLGPGFLESIYERSLCAELARRGLSYRRQVRVPIEYKGEVVGDSRLDLLVADCLVVELKAITAFEPVHLMQVRSYLKATGLRLGLLLNFNVPVLLRGVRRVVFTP